RHRPRRQGHRRAPCDRLPPVVSCRLHRHEPRQARGAVPMNGLTLARGITILTFKWVGIGLVGLALFIVILAAFGDRDSLVYRYWARYTSSIERKLRPMFIFTPGRVIAAAQLAALFVTIVLELTIGLPFFPAWIIAICALPLLQIESMRRKRL